MENQKSEIQLQQLWTIIAKGKYVVLLISVLVVVTVGLYTFFTRPVFESTSRVLVNNKGNQSSINFLEIQAGDVSIKVANEVENLKSYSMAQSVTKTILQKERTNALSSRIHSVIFGPADTVNNPNTLARITENVMKAVEFLPAKESDVIKIVARSTNPEEAALLANSYAGEFVNRNLDVSRSKTKAVREFLESQMHSEGEALDNAEQSLQDYMRSSGVVSLESESKRVTEQLSELEARHNALEIEISERQKTLDSYKKVLAEQGPDLVKSIEQSNDVYVRMLQEQLATLEVQRDVIIAQNPDLVGKKIYSQKLKDLDTQIGTLKDNLRQRTKDYLAALQPGQTQITGQGSGAGFLAELKQKIIEQQIELQGLMGKKEALAKVIGSYDLQFNQIPKKSIELARRQRSAMSSEKLYLMLKEKFNEVSISEQSDLGYAELIDEGIVPLKPVSPVVWLNMILALVGGVGVGVVAVLLRAEMDVRVRDPEDLKKVGYSPLSTIGIIPLDSEERKMDDIDSSKFDKHLIALHNPLSPITESYRYLQAHIEAVVSDSESRTVVITSTNPGEGKSTTSANLAITFAESEKKVLLVDADLRRPTISAMFGLKAAPGLTDMLLGKAHFEEVIHHSVLPHLDILCSGEVAVRSASLLGSEAMKNFIDFFKTAYDVVIFDSPPVHAVSDSTVLSKNVDGAILVVAAASTKMPSLKRALDSFSNVGGRLIGTVLNNYDVRKTYKGTYGGEGYGYYNYGYSPSTNGKRKLTQHS